MSAEPPSNPTVTWDLGTGYDLFASLLVLQEPERFGLRASWAAGVRSRLPIKARKTLDLVYRPIGLPLGWLFSLPAPKDASAAIQALGLIPASERVHTLLQFQRHPDDVRSLLEDVSARQNWNEQDLEGLRSLFRRHGEDGLRQKVLASLLETWSRAAELGEPYLAALGEFHNVFFVEEERRIEPALHARLAEAQDLAVRLPLPELLEELSQGVRLAELDQVSGLTLVPSYWITPFISLGHRENGGTILLFGARPKDVSLIPGELVPDALLQPLKALGDGTRLRILRYLAGQPMTPSTLARLLRLRPPTVIHHLDVLRLAGLVQITIGPNADRRYAARLESIQSLVAQLGHFLGHDVRHEPSDPQ